MEKALKQGHLQCLKIGERKEKRWTDGGRENEPGLQENWGTVSLEGRDESGQRLPL